MTSLRFIVAVSVACGVTAATPHGAGADSDLALTCGPDFGVFDRGLTTQRRLYVVPWREEGDLVVSGSVLMDADQPHSWLIYGRFVVVRSWNDIHIFRIDENFLPAKIFTSPIDDARGNVGGTVEVELVGSVVRAYGTTRVLEVDLNRCGDSCTSRTAAFAEPPQSTRRPPVCRVRRGDLEFASVTTTMRGDAGVFHDLLLTRRDLRASAGQDRFRLESLLYLGTKLETVD